MLGRYENSISEMGHNSSRNSVNGSQDRERGEGSTVKQPHALGQGPSCVH